MKKIFVIIAVSIFFIGFQPTYVLAADNKALVASHDGQVRKIG